MAIVGPSIAPKEKTKSDDITNIGLPSLSVVSWQYHGAQF